MTEPLDLGATRAKDLINAANAAARAIPPLWPLASSVAVNPFLGQTDHDLAESAARLARVAGVPVTMPRSWYGERIARGEITDDDLASALAAAPQHELRPHDVVALRAAAAAPEPLPKALPTIADLAAESSGIDWPGLLAERFGAFASSYFDAGQALWAAAKGKSAYAAWRAVATRDLTPEIQGLPGFASRVVEAPETAEATLAEAVGDLGLGSDALPTYFHQLLMTLGGWAQYARYQLWQAELAQGADDILIQFLAIRLLWERVLYERYRDRIAERWETTRRAHAEPLRPTRDQVADAILQEAAERAAQRMLIETLEAPAPEPANRRPTLQAVFCIDVRSEVYRRALEAIDPKIDTLGFAGFFGVFAAHRRFASDVEERRLPVLLNPTVKSCSGGPEVADKDQAARLTARASRAWGRFKFAAVSSFAFVEASGPIYVGKLVRDALGLAPASAPNDPPPRLDPALDPEVRVNAAETVLRAMSLTANFARVVLLAGHGANVVNNPHASALHCGACGGYAGDVNARLLAALLNDPETRQGLVPRGIEIPKDTLFLGALHDTTTDGVTIYAGDHPSSDHAKDLERIRSWLRAAGELARGERALRLPRATSQKDIARRSRDWAEVRPEWALAGCKAFIAAPRQRTAGRNLEGRAFLHDYDWHRDDGFGVLELIMTAPVVVASWISLQYYGSTVAPQVFGAGNKLLHNVIGGIGVVEGNGGVLRAGLPWQSVHDGDKLIHEPLRLSVCIEAPCEAITDILRRHEAVRALFDHRWLHLFAIDERGRMAWRYVGDLEWNTLATEALQEPPLRAAG